MSSTQPPRRVRIVDRTLSLDACTQRQRRYAGRLPGQRVYTPQLVINGSIEVVGSSERRVRSGLERASRVPEIALALTGSILTFDVPEVDADFELVLVPFDATHTQPILSGENEGRTVTYANPVNDLVLIDGASRRVDVSSHPATGGYAILAQGRDARILAAGQILR